MNFDGFLKCVFLTICMTYKCPIYVVKLLENSLVFGELVSVLHSDIFVKLYKLYLVLIYHHMILYTANVTFSLDLGVHV